MSFSLGQTLGLISTCPVLLVTNLLTGSEIDQSVSLKLKAAHHINTISDVSSAVCRGLWVRRVRKACWLA